MEEKIEKEQVLSDLYYSPKTGYRSPQHLWDLVKEEYPHLKISKYFVKQWLLQQSAYTRSKKWNNPKHYRHTFVRDFDQIQIDLFEPGRSEKIIDENDGYKYVLVGIEILSRYGFGVPLKERKGKTIAGAIEKIIKEYREHFERENPKCIQYDPGVEFINDPVKKFLDREGIVHSYTKSPRQATVVERFNRTLRLKMTRRFEANKNHKWADHFEDLVENYNNTVHSSIGIKPKDASEENKHIIWLRLFGGIVKIKDPKLKVGDKVRVFKLNRDYRTTQLPPLPSGLKNKEKIEKGLKEGKYNRLGAFMREQYNVKNVKTGKVIRRGKGIKAKELPFSPEIFVVSRVLLGDPNVYKLYSEDVDEEVLGIFYAEELSLIK